MATKRGKRPAAQTTKMTKTTSKKAAAAPAADRRRAAERGGADRRGATANRVVEPRSAERRTAPDRRAGGGEQQPTLLGRAIALRDAIQRSKLTAPDPWAYTGKARKWGERAQGLVDRAARGDDAGPIRQAVDALTAEVERDRDYQEARRLF